ncbi:MAG: hypothetical protein NZ560_04940, partial [Aquificaceae bacterium]|nr:hypothetical protein [Aquificaceae bacterium]
YLLIVLRKRIGLRERLIGHARSRKILMISLILFVELLGTFALFPSFLTRLKDPIDAFYWSFSLSFSLEQRRLFYLLEVMCG